MKKYKLKKDMPMLSAGALFEHREYDESRPDLGNKGHGVLLLSWGANRGTQKGWCGETFIMPGQLAENTDWFELMNEDDRFTELRDIIVDLSSALAKLSNND